MDKNKIFCILPWVHLQLRQNGEVYPCCRSVNGYSYGSLKNNSINEIWNGEKIKHVRREILSGVPQDFCSDCYNLEKLGNKSHRNNFNECFIQEFSRKNLTEEDGTLRDSDAIYFDIRFSNVCNFKCRSCGPESSTSWFEDQKGLFGCRSTEQKVFRLENSSKNIWPEIDEKFSKITHVYFAGGEPLLDKDHYHFLEKLIEKKRTDVWLSYNSNFSTLKFMKWNAISLWQKFENVQVSASIDDIGPALELTRKGANWEQIRQNIILVKNFLPKLRLIIYPTVSVLNCFNLPRLISYFLESNTIVFENNLELNILNSPEYLNVKILNDVEKNSLESLYADYLKTLKNKIPLPLYTRIELELERVIKFARSEDLTSQRKYFRKQTFILDRLRNEKTVKVIPELFDLLYEKDT